jgi:hypothetical protein
MNIGFKSPELSEAPAEECVNQAADKVFLILFRGLAFHWKLIAAYEFVGTYKNKFSLKAGTS